MRPSATCDADCMLVGSIPSPPPPRCVMPLMVTVNQNAATRLSPIDSAASGNDDCRHNATILSSRRRHYETRAALRVKAFNRSSFSEEFHRTNKLDSTWLRSSIRLPLGSSGGILKTDAMRRRNIEDGRTTGRRQRQRCLLLTVEPHKTDVSLRTENSPFQFESFSSKGFPRSLYVR